MSNMQPHDLHRMVRSWLLSEDPYGLNSGSGSMQGGRIEPTFGEPPHQAQDTQDIEPLTPREIAAWARVKGSQPTQQEIDDWQNQKRVARGLPPRPPQAQPAAPQAQPKGAYRPPWKTPNTTKGSYWGGKAVSGEMDKANAEMKADQLGGNAVARELGPELAGEPGYNAMARELSPELAGEPGYNAVARATSPAAIRDMIQQMSQPQPSAYTPEEAAAYANWQGHNAVAGVTPPRGPEGWYPPQPMTPQPMTPPGQGFGPQSVAPTPETESTSPDQGYAPSAKRASHWGVKAVENWLDKEQE